MFQLNYLKNEISSIEGNTGKKGEDFTRYVMLFMHRGTDILEKNFEKIN